MKLVGDNLSKNITQHRAVDTCNSLPRTIKYNFVHSD